MTRKSSGGFTIVELLMVTAVLSIALLGGMLFFNSTLAYMAGNAVSLELAFNTRKGVELIIRDIQNAKAIYSSHSGYASSSSALVLKTMSLDSNGVPTDEDSDFDYIIYHADPADPAVVQRTVDALDGTSARFDGTTDIITDVDSYSFNYDTAQASSASKVQISITTADTFLTRRLESRFSTSVTLRNRRTSV